jgi:peptidoglycan/LPS O-acetylase OafA/YrhL
VSFGNLAVFGFFFLSGYLTTQSWTHEPSALQFLKKRALRLYPAFVVASVLSVFVVGPLGASAPHYFSSWEPHKFMSDLLSLRQPRTPPVFEGSRVPSVNGSMWTITFELRCYLIMALLGVIGLVRRPILMCLLTLLLVAASSATAPSHAGAEGASVLGISGFMFWFATVYLSGACFFLFRARMAKSWGLAVVAAGLYVACLFWPTEVFRPVGLIAGGYLLVFAGDVQSPALEKLRMRDDLSYGIYLYGWPLTKLTDWWLPAIEPLLMFAFVIVGSTALAFVSWRLIEKPTLRFKRRSIT